MTPRNYFPLGKAYGEAFCNRTAETEWLVGNIENTKHSLLIAPRRFGKSSLAQRAIEKTKYPYVDINFHLCTSENEVKELILRDVIKLVGKAVGPVEKLMTSIQKYLSNLTPKISFGGEMASLELVHEKEVNPAVAIAESLLLLDNLLREKNKRAVIFFDEFQEIVKITKDHALEGAIRTAAQECQNLSIIFSGSIRSLLLMMFNDETRPLYKLCRKLKVERISEVHYRTHLNKIAQETWGENLDENTFKAIITCSNRHPYYVNYLCDILWDQRKILPKSSDVIRAWKIVLEEEWRDALKEISLLSLNQRRILKYIANNDVTGMTSQESSQHLKLPVSTIASVAESLVDKDYAEVENGIYKIIDPLLLTVLSQESLEEG